MQILFIIPAFFVFLYCVYKLVKDDYVFIRKGVSLEQMFDVIFGVVWAGIFSSRLFYILLHPITDTNLVMSFFSALNGGFSLVGGVLGGVLALYLIAKYRKLPVGRLFDFLTLSFLIALPVGFILSAFSYGQELLYLFIAQAIFYLIFVVLFMKLLYPKLMSRNLKEGMISLYFFLIYFALSFAASFGYTVLKHQSIASFENILVVVCFIGSSFLLFKQESKNKQRK